MSVLDQRDEDTFTLVIISAAQWKKKRRKCSLHLRISARFAAEKK
jgi:hypothetical protein